MIFYGQLPDAVLMTMTTKCLLVQHSYKLFMSGHGPDHVVLCIPFTCCGHGPVSSMYYRKSLLSPCVRTVAWYSAYV